jgi:Uma2 family endonuclease
MELAKLNLNALYTYADYLRWTFEERVELIKGKIFPMSAPNRMHQELSMYLVLSIGNFLNGKQCKVYSAPFDVRLPRKSKDEQDIMTVLQPDICVVCDTSKLDYKGCLGAPELIVEILSPSNNVAEFKHKYEVYEEAGVLEYWVVSPQDKTFLVYTLVDSKFVPTRTMVAGDVVHSSVLPGFTLDLADMFSKID